MTFVKTSVLIKFKGIFEYFKGCAVELIWGHVPTRVTLDSRPDCLLQQLHMALLHKLAHRATVDAMAEPPKMVNKGVTEQETKQQLTLDRVVKVASHLKGHGTFFQNFKQSKLACSWLQTDHSTVNILL